MKIVEQNVTMTFRYPVVFTRDVFDPRNSALSDIVRSGGHTHNRMLAVIDSEVARLDPTLPERIGRYGAVDHPLIDWVAPPFVVRGGEICKRDPVEVAALHALIERHKLDRHSYIVVIGGGAVLDAMGYAAATAHRGIRLIRLPTTVLAQNDAGIGVKNGINAFGKKNFLGTFAPPFAVVNDSAFLEFLPARDRRAGLAEAVKVALIRDRAFFDFLYARRGDLARFEATSTQTMIERCAELHLDHIARYGDPFECGSSRPLDFGHWAAHKLEELSNHELRHGEAVAIGIAIDATYAHLSGELSEIDWLRVINLLDNFGFEFNHPVLYCLNVDLALEEFREHLGGTLSLPLLTGIGRMVEVSQIQSDLVKRGILHLLERASSRQQTTVKLPFDIPAGVSK